MMMMMNSLWPPEDLYADLHNQLSTPALTERMFFFSFFNCFPILKPTLLIRQISTTGQYPSVGIRHYSEGEEEEEEEDDNNQRTSLATKEHHHHHRLANGH